MNKLLYFFSTIFFIMVNVFQSQAQQVIEAKDEYAHKFYVIEDEDTNYKHVLQFYKTWNQESQQYEIDYSTIGYHQESSGTVIRRRRLGEDIKWISIGMDYILKVLPNLDLKMFEICDPVCWDDVIDRHVKAFSKNEEWKKDGVKDKVVANPILMNKIMMEYKVYGMLDDMLQKYGFTIAEYSVHKIGLFGPKLLKIEAQYTYSGKTYIPIPGEFAIILKRK